MSSRLRHLVPALAFGGSMLGCDEPTSLEGVVAEYALVSLASSMLPAAPFEGAGTTILGDTIRLREDGTGARTVWYQAGDTRALYGADTRLTWRASGDTLEVSLACDDMVLASCIAPPHLSGRIEPGMQWVVPRAVLYNDASAVYQRVGMR